MTTYNEAGVRRFFRTGPEDIPANRAGRLGPAQRKNFRFLLIFWSVIVLFWVVCMGFALYIQLDGESWHGWGNFIFSVAFAALIAAVPLLTIVSALRWLSPTLVVTSLKGRVSVHFGYLTVGDHRLAIDRPYNGRGGRGPELGPWIDESLIYEVFAARGRAIGMLPVGKHE